MNKKGQTLILFVILIPIMIAIIAFVVDYGSVIYQKIRVEEVTKMAIENTKSDNYDTNKIKKILEKNEIAIDSLEVTKEKKKIHVKNEFEVASIFGSIIGKKEYHVMISFEIKSE